ncbi:MAG TPA: hypothetical protein VFI11_05030 [Anaerolineales bacterium]|nr:hypothetical protein [Anaerolineales bacterium]
MATLPADLRRLEIGGGLIRLEEDGIRLSLPALGRGYADAQLDDTSGRPRHRFLHHPVFQMSVRARASTANPVGTLGFGLWNDPFGFSLGLGGAARRMPAAPQALWFFNGSPPNDLAFARPGVASGWKAAALRSPRLPWPLVVAGGGLVLAAGLVRRLQAALVRTALHRVQASEVRLDFRLDEWHTYALEWIEGSAAFRVDGEIVLETRATPTPPLGFVTWIDNQFAVLSPSQGMRFGVVPVPEPQFLELRNLTVGAA